MHVADAPFSFCLEESYTKPSLLSYPMLMLLTTTRVKSSLTCVWLPRPPLLQAHVLQALL
jgi:hypothetical protein